jgi:protease I
MFEDEEYAGPAKAFTDAGHELVHIGLTAKETVAGKNQDVRLQTDMAVRDASVADFDALFVPGGYSPDRLRVNEDAVRFARDFLRSGKPVFAICHAPQLFITANVLKGRKVAGWKSIIQDIRNAGAEYVDKPVVEDGNLISSRGPEDIRAFVRAALGRLSAVKQPART